MTSRELAFALVGWAVVLGAVVVQEIALNLLGGRPAGAGDALAFATPLIALWALATPIIVTVARRWPVRAPRRFRHAVVQAAAAIAFVITFNVIIRIPLMVEGGPLLANLGRGLARYGPFALVVYGIVVALAHFRRARPPSPPVLTIGNGGATVVLSPGEIEWIEARGNYVRVHERSGMRLVRQTLSSLERLLDGNRFVRIHRSAIVGMHAVRELRPRSHGDAVIVLRDGRELRVARTRRRHLQALLDPRSNGAGTPSDT